MDRAAEFYEKEHLQDSQIRLLKLRHDLPDSPLFGELHISAFPYRETADTERPEYEALSYYWGPKAPTGSEAVIRVLVGSGLYPVPIRPNLEKALKRLRSHEKDRWLWVDALCIYQKKHNQFATQEKNLQLPIMHEIYNRARRVCVWLGPEEGHSTSAMNFVERINKLDDFHKFMTDDHHEAQDLANFALLLRRPWFNRRWIVQEIATARDAQIYCGPAELPWKDFAQAVSLFASRVTDVKRKFRASAKFGHSPDYLGDIREYSAFQLVYADSSFFRKSEDGTILQKSKTLEEVVSVLSTFEGYDPRDVVYAVVALSRDVKARTRDRTEFMIDEDKENEFLRMKYSRPQSPLELNQKEKIASPGDKPSFEKAIGSSETDGHLDVKAENVRYAFRKVARAFSEGVHGTITIKTDAPVFEVYRDFLELAVRNSKSLDILCRPWAADVQDEELPSWIQCQSKATHSLRKNRAYRRIKGDLFVGSPRTGGKLYDASGPLSQARWRYQDTEDLRKLSLSRSLVVEGYILDEVEQKFHTALGAQIPVDWFNARKGPAASKNPTDAFWRTLVGDRGPEGRKQVPQYYQAAFEYLVKQMPPYGALDVNEVIQEEDFPPEVKEFVERMHAVVCMRRFVITKDDRMGLVPLEAKKRDKIAIIDGCSVPVVLRECPLPPLSALICHPLTNDTMSDESRINDRSRKYFAQQTPAHVNAQQGIATEANTVDQIPETTADQSPALTAWKSLPNDLRPASASRHPSFTVTSYAANEAGGETQAQATNSLPSPERRPEDRRSPERSRGGIKKSPSYSALTQMQTANISSSRRGSTTSRHGSGDSLTIPTRYYKFIGECYIHGVMEGETARYPNQYYKNSQSPDIREKPKFWLR